MDSWIEIAYFLIYLGLTTFLTVIAKLVAFKRIESVSIDVALYSTLYCIFHSIPSDNIYSVINTIWIYKGIFNLCFLIGLLAAHTLSYDHLHEKIEDDIEELKSKLKAHKNKDTLSSLKSIVMLATEVAYSKWKPGKRRRRKKIRETIRKLNLDPDDLLVNDEAFMLSQSYSRTYKYIFMIVPALVIINTIFPMSLINSIIGIKS